MSVHHPHSTTAATNRRSALRRQPAVGTVCRFSFGAAHKDHVGLVWNLSTSGISMLLDEPPESGALIDAELATVDDRAALPVTLRVVHIKPIRTGDYVLGAQFQKPLAAEEMRPFMAEPYVEG